MKKVLIGGGTGLVGHFLSQLLRDAGYEVRLLSRSNHPDKSNVFQWDLKKGIIDSAAFRELDYVINLAGAGIADKRWTAERKKLIIDSRVLTTNLLLKYIREEGASVKAFVSASAIGYYGDSGETEVSETSGPGTGFLAESTQAWEDAIFQDQQTIRTAAIRIGIVSSTNGGALAKLILPARFGLATYFGDGQQWFSWIHIQDLCRMFLHLLEQESLSGSFNGVAPNPVRMKSLVAGIREAVGIPGLMLPIPEFLMRIPMGEMADVLFTSARVSSKKVEDTGFNFAFPALQPALKDILQRRI
ncbi:MAG: TIGR01777 family oxidoreductase [Saprospiraceae bacterium]|nr:TIGR01777 family oxidoreductase [Saprospiraceae bacterium]